MNKIQFWMWFCLTSLSFLIFPGNILLAEINADQKMLVDEFKNYIDNLSDEHMWILRENILRQTTEQQPCLCSPKTHIVPGTAAVIIHCSCGKIECVISYHPTSMEPTKICFKN